jgi:hypothetical protein
VRTRQRDWFNLRTKKIRLSFQVYIQGKWCYLSRDTKPLLFKTEAERDRIQAIARKAKNTRELDEMIEAATRRRKT